MADSEKLPVQRHRNPNGLQSPPDAEVAPIEKKSKKPKKKEKKHRGREKEKRREHERKIEEEEEEDDDYKKVVCGLMMVSTWKMSWAAIDFTWL